LFRPPSLSRASPVTSPIEFYFDFSSPYSYLASEEIEALAERHGRELRWRPLLLGAVLKVAGGAPLTEGYGPKARYSLRDFARSAAFLGVPYRQPSVFPIGAVAASRAVLWLQREHPAQVSPFVHAVFRAFFAGDRNVAELPVVLDIATGLGIDAATLAAAVQGDALKAALRAEVDEAIVRGVFGAPTIFVDGEQFWGHDRLMQVERWITTGPF
jgi:2-hydroxychromene-2-carboxylate isomerase